jgi:hypothetical protein
MVEKEGHWLVLLISFVALGASIRSRSSMVSAPVCRASPSLGSSSKFWTAPDVSMPVRALS